jgi:hypothetical protein
MTGILIGVFCLGVAAGIHIGVVAALVYTKEG